MVLDASIAVIVKMGRHAILAPLCEMGFTGKLCDQECRPYTFGFYCAQTCNCSAETSNGCDPQTGRCRCKAGYSGDNCERGSSLSFTEERRMAFFDTRLILACASGRWGGHCLNQCDCQGNPCHPQNGTCQCPAGRTDCPSNTFGIGCQPCSCASFQTCDVITGECQCPAGSKGDACQFPLTANGLDLRELPSGHFIGRGRP
ncbi:unnamed protein product [Didymodactylos carnosus]|uniref:Laminin EGF-like domain-containing protein n=1 Tax=Didymodactylos carnosus TaxID=1234261 RepID=A0A815PF29_9BILA|nr:unnamed protein product [Didymodactylos carnosus]CAF4322244.1 unnamed protein product [Didymodactylos carnosus]